MPFEGGFGYLQHRYYKNDRKFIVRNFANTNIECTSFLTKRIRLGISQATLFDVRLKQNLDRDS